MLRAPTRSNISERKNPKLRNKMMLHELYCVKKLGGAMQTARVMVGMTPPGVAMLLCTLLVVLFTGVASANSMPAVAHPGFDSGLCEVPSLRGSRRIVDISHALRPDLPSWEEEGGIGEVLQLVASMRNGSLANQSQLSRLGVHTGTHVDAPSHIFQEYYDLGDHVHTLDLHKLNGLALIVDAPRHSNLTAESMLALNIPHGVERVIFRTLNTDRRLMWKRQFDTSYVGFTTDGAQWLKDNTDIKLIGVDYLSVASYDHLIPAHKVFLQEKDIVLVEGLNLDDVETGLYDLHCLPLQVLNSDGAPIRCIVEK